MSSLLNFVLRHDGVLHQAVITSGGLSEVFDPLIFQGDQVAIASYLNRCTVQPMGSFAPYDSGLVVIDLDQKTIWDVQVARALNRLSSSLDHSWIHLEKLSELGWLGMGLVDPKTNEIVVPYPPTGVHYGWYLDQVEHHNKQFKKDHPDLGWEGDDFKFPAMMALVKSQPRVPFSPLGWTLKGNVVQIEVVAPLRAGLIKAGFPIKKRDTAKWRAWIAQLSERQT